MTVRSPQCGRGAFSSTKCIGMEYISVSAVSQHSCEWFLIMLCCYSGHGPLTNRSGVTRCLYRPQVMPLYNCDLSEVFFIFNSNINNTSAPTYFVPLFYPAVMMFEETHANNTLKQKTIKVTFTSYLTDMQETTCLALQVKRPSSLPTDRNKNDVVI